MKAYPESVRREAIDQFDALMRTGATKIHSVSKLKVSYTTLWRWQQRLLNGESLERRKPTGRPPHMKFSAEELAAMLPYEREIVNQKPAGFVARRMRESLNSAAELPGSMRKAMKEVL